MAIYLLFVAKHAETLKGAWQRLNEDQTMLFWYQSCKQLATHRQWRRTQLGTWSMDRQTKLYAWLHCSLCWLAGFRPFRRWQLRGRRKPLSGWQQCHARWMLYGHLHLLATPKFTTTHPGKLSTFSQFLTQTAPIIISTMLSLAHVNLQVQRAETLLANLCLSVIPIEFPSQLIVLLL